MSKTFEINLDGTKTDKGIQIEGVALEIGGVPVGVFFGPDAATNAALIVTAVNAHEALVEQLTKARALVEKWCHYQGNTRALFDEHLGPIDAALLLAEGEKE